MSKKPRLWVSRPTFDDIIDPLAEYFEVHAEEVDRGLSPAELKSRLADSEAAIVGPKDRIGAEEIAGATKLRIVANLAVGFDNLDIKALSAAGIAASNTPGVLDDSVADFTWALMLGAARRVGEAERWVRDGQWTRPGTYLDWLGVDLFNGTLGILGMGRIGQAVARRAIGFRMSVLYHNRSRLDSETERDCGARYVDMATLLRESDALVLLVPRTPQTHHLISADELASMKRRSVLINVARGGVVDEVALAEALTARRIAAAGLDVFADEPTIHPALLGLDNAVLTPHIASATTETRRTMARLGADNVLAVFGFGENAGKPPTLLNPEVLSGPRHEA